MHVINHEWNRSMFGASTVCFVWNTKLDFPTMRAIFQQNHPLTIKLKSSNLVNTKLLIQHETNKTINKVKRKKVLKFFF